MAKMTKPLSLKRLRKLADKDDPHIKRLVWEVSQTRPLLKQVRQLLDHWGEESWQINMIRDSLIERLDDL